MVFFSTNVFAEKVNDIEISGNKRISKQTILVLSNISKGDDLDPSKINNSIKKLYNSNFFKDIKFNLINGKLKIDVIENPIIEDIEFTGIKVKNLPKKSLKV